MIVAECARCRDRGEVVAVHCGARYVFLVCPRCVARLATGLLDRLTPAEQEEWAQSALAAGMEPRGPTLVREAKVRRAAWRA